MYFTQTIKRGAHNGFKTTLELAKVLLPVYLIVTILKHTVLLAYIADIFAPLMKCFGLPGEAAMVLVLGNILNLYAAIGAISSIAFTTKQVTIIAIMLSFSHNLIVETAVSKKTGVSVILVLTVRIGLAIIFGYIMNLLL